MQCNGKCHLAKQFELAAPKNSEDPQSQSINLVFESFFPVFFQTLVEESFSSPSIKLMKLETFNYSNLYTYNLAENLLKPPIV